MRFGAQRPLFRADQRRLRTRAERRERLYPIIHCRRSLETGRAVTLTAKAADDYIRLVALGRFPIVNAAGEVAGSRATLLEGVRSVEQAGKP